MQRQGLIAAVAARAGVPEDVTRRVLEALLGASGNVGMLGEALLRGERFVWSGFGTFELRHRAARPGRNPRTGEPLQVPAARVVGFRAAAALRRAVQSPPGPEPEAAARVPGKAAPVEGGDDPSV